MTPAEIPLKTPGLETATEVTRADVEQVERALIDASTRVPVLMFYTSAIVWLSSPAEPRFRFTRFHAS